jgi:hypothetical protein
MQIDLDPSNKEFRRFRRKLVAFGYGLSALVAAVFAAGWWHYGSEIKIENSGDYMGAAISSLALIWLLIGIYLQGYEISLQTKEMSESKQELARQAEALVEQIELIKEQAKVVASQVELSKASTSHAMYQNLLADLSREIRSGTTMLIAYDSEQHVTRLEESRKSGNLKEYVDTFYLELLGIGAYDLVHYIERISIAQAVDDTSTAEEWRISDTKRLSYALCVAVVKNLRSIARFTRDVELLELQSFQRFDFLEHVLASLSSLRYVSLIWSRLDLPMEEMSKKLRSYVPEVDEMMPKYISRIEDYPDWEAEPVLANLRRCNGLLGVWESDDYVEIR